MSDNDAHVQFDIEIEEAQNKRKVAITEVQEALETTANTLKAELDETQAALYLEEIKHDAAVNRITKERETARKLYNDEIRAIDEEYDDAITESRLRYRQALGHVPDA